MAKNKNLLIDYINLDEGNNENIIKTARKIIEASEKDLLDFDCEENPFYLVSLDNVHLKYKNWILKLPRVEPFYAIKCNPNPLIVKLLAFLGVGFDCASKDEMEAVLSLPKNISVNPDRIIYAHTCKLPSYIQYARYKKVDKMTFDNELELLKIKKYHPEAKLVLRISTNDSHAVFKLSLKFGATMNTAFKLIDLAIKLNLNLIGVSFHVGSGQLGADVFKESIINCRRLFDYTWDRHNIQMYFLDIGGGFPGTMSNMSIFDHMAIVINETLDEYFSQELIDEFNCRINGNTFKIIAEPGTYFVQSSLILCANIFAKRVVNDESEENIASIYNYYINDGRFGSMYVEETKAPIIIRMNSEETNDKNENQKLHKTTIWGPTCDSSDYVLRNFNLPELFIGDFIAIVNNGAYTDCLFTRFNQMPWPKYIYVKIQDWVIFEDILNEE